MNDMKVSHRTSARFETTSCISLILALTMFCLSGCEALKEADRKRLPSISKSRPLGSPCGPKDSASIKRFDPPFKGNGTWAFHQEDFVDLKRTMDVKSNSLTRYNGCIVGFVKFDKPGYLQERIYDDVYGDIYEGWNPRKLNLKPTAKPVYISLRMVSNASGGQIHEVCWFPEGAKEGVLVFSTAYPDPGQKLTPADLYGPEQLGNEYQFWDNIACDAINSNLKNGKIENAKKILKDSAKVLSSGRGAVDGSTQIPIPQKTFNAAHWALLAAYEAGLALGEPTFNAKRKQLEEVMNGPHWPKEISYDEIDYQNMLPLYCWLNEQITNKKSPLPKLDEGKNCVAGHDPKTVTAYLQADAAHEDKLTKPMFDNIDFWIGVKNFLRKNYKMSDEHLKTFIEDRHSGSDAFEVAAAAKLRNFMFFDLHPEK